MTLRNLLCNPLSKEDLKQNKYFMIIHTIILLLVSTLPALLIINNYNNFSMQNGLLRDIYETLTMGTSFTFFIVCLIGTITGTISFSYLFSTKAVIFYHSMPHKRETIFTSKIISGIISIILPVLTVCVINMIIYLATGFFNDVNFKYYLISYLDIILMYVFVFSVSAFAASLSSNVFAQYLVIGFIYLVYPVTSLVIMGFVEGFTNTFEFMPHLFEKPQYLFPPMELLSNISFDFKDIFLTRFEINVWLCVYTLVVSLAFLIVSVLIYRKRKTENTNKFVAFNFLKAFLKYYITACISVGVSILFFMITKASVFGAIIGLVIGSFIVFNVLEAIFEKSVKSMFKNIKGFLVTTVVLCVLVIACSSLMSKYDKQFPTNVKSIEFTQLPTHLHEVNDVVLKDADNVKYAVEFLNKTAVKKDDENSYRNYITVTCDKYKFWGFKRHFYNATDAEIADFTSKIYDSKEYKESLTNFGDGEVNYMNFNDEKAKYANQLVGYYGPDKNQKDGDERCFKVINALKNDIMKYSYDETKNSDTEFKISFSIDGKSFYMDVKECYKETIKALKEGGFLLGENESIVKMAFANYETDGEEFEVNYGVEDDLILKEMLNQPSRAQRWDEKRIFVRFYYPSGVCAFSMEYTFDNLPESAKEYIVENEIPIFIGDKRINPKTEEVIYDGEGYYKD